MKKVVCLGGGNAMPNVVLSEIKKQKIELSVISAVLDSGGSSGKLREEYSVVAPGDLRRALFELSELDKQTKEVLNYRFKKGFLKDHNLSNLIITSILLEQENPVIALNAFFKTKYKVFPATLKKANLCAKLKNGEVVVGETNIDVPKHNSQIKEVFLDKEVSIFKETREKLLEAEVIIIGPGDLYSSLIQILLVKGMREAIKKSSAKIFYICNLKNKKGETDGFYVEDFEKEIEKYLGKKIDHIIFNNNIKNKEFDLVQFKEYNDLRHIGLDLLKEDKIMHDPKKLINQIMKLI